jgi:hypothetical protein
MIQKTVSGGHVLDNSLQRVLQACQTRPAHPLDHLHRLLVLDCCKLFSLVWEVFDELSVREITSEDAEDLVPVVWMSVCKDTLTLGDWINQGSKLESSAVHVVDIILRRNEWVKVDIAFEQIVDPSSCAWSTLVFGAENCSKIC